MNKEKSPSRWLYHKVKGGALKALGNKCLKCGFNDYAALQIDHIHGDGWEERRRKHTRKSQFNLYKFIVSDPDLASLRYQLLCANCNWIKRVANKEYRRPLRTVQG